MRTFLRKVSLAFTVVLALCALDATSAHASHFRYGTISWAPTATVGEVEFKIKNGFRRSFFTGTAADGRPKIGDSVSFQTFNFGDGASVSPPYKITAIDVAADWAIGEATVRHTYANVGTGTGTFTAFYASSARLSNLMNRRDGNWRGETIVTPRNGNSSPVSTMLPTITVAQNTTAHFFVPASDPNGDNLTYRISTDFEATGINSSPATTTATAATSNGSPPGLSINSLTGEVSWNTTGLVTTNPYTAMFVIEDRDINGAIKSKTFVDVMLQVSSAAGVAPECEIHTAMAGQPVHGPITTIYGVPISFKVEGFDDDAGATVTLNTAGLPAGATMTPTLPTTGSSGVLSNFSWTPTQSQIGSYVFSYSATDNNGLQTLESMSVNVIDNAVVANDDSYSTNKNQLLTVPAPGVLGNDTQQGTNTLTTVLVTNPIHGGVVLNSDGSFTYTPDSNFFGTDSFRYRAKDGATNSNFATVTITVNQVNRAPVADANSLNTSEETALPITLTASDLDGDALTYSIGVQPQHGTLGVITGNQVTYTPALNYNGPDSFTFKANDGLLDSNEATVSLTVDPVNDAPALSVANATVTTNEGATATNTGTFSDVDDLLADVTLSASEGTVSKNDTDGTWTWSKATTDEEAAHTVTISAKDSSGAISTVTFTLIVGNVNPAATNNSYTLAEGGSLSGNVLTDGTPDSDAGANDALTVTGHTQPAHGTLTIAADGSFTYTHDGGESTSDSFDYTISDGDGGTATATVTLNITPVNDAPTISSIGAQSTKEDSATSAIDFTVGDVESAATDLTVSGSSDNLALVPAGSIVFGGTGANRSLTITPAPNQFGTATITVSVSDPTDATNETFSLTVSAVNDAPSFTKGANQNAPEDAGTQTVANWATDISAGPANEAGQVLSFELSNNNSALFTAGGQPSLSADGTLTYTPAPNASGTATVTVKLHDDGGTALGGVDSSSEQTFTITVTAVNDAPVAQDDSTDTDEDTAVDIPVLSNDSDVDNDNSDLRVASLSNVTGGSAVILADGRTIRFTPAANANGATGFGLSYKVKDTDNAQSNSATVTIRVRAINDAPVSADDAATTSEDTAVTIAAPGVLGNDSDVEGNALTAIQVSNAAHGNVTLNANGSFTYTPSANFNGSDSFTYKANDGGANSSAATVAITVSAVNDAPTVAQAIANVTVDEDAADTQITLAPIFADADIATNADELSFTVSSNNPALLSATISNGKVVLHYALNANGIATITVQAKDKAGATVQNSFLVTVRPVNDAPVANDDAASTISGAPVTVAAPGVLGNDTDVENNPLTAVKVSDPTYGSVTLNANGSFTYTPNADYFGTDTFTYKAKDSGNALSNEATVKVKVDLPANTSGVRVTGDGTIATSGGSGAFSLVAVSNNISGSPAQGTLTYKDTAAGVNIKSPTITRVVTNGIRAWVFGEELQANGSLLKFMAYIEDRGEPGRAVDTFSISLSNGYSAGARLASGNLQVHKSK